MGRVPITRLLSIKGDLIQTGSEGVARIAFADGTTYTVKGDTLVTVEENIVEQDRASKVGVHISSGQVDLRTATWSVPGSKAEVSFENAVASLRENSEAAVRSDPETKEQQITVDAGSAELNRGAEHVDIGQYERATFPTGPAPSPKHRCWRLRSWSNRSTCSRSSSPTRSTTRFTFRGSRRPPRRFMTSRSALPRCSITS